MNGKWEVEQKYYVDDAAGLRERLIELDFGACETESHRDTYFRHPCRDFRATDEAFRLRMVNEAACLTYKGPRAAGAVKTRPEIELSVTAAEQEQWRRMLTCLGFQPVPAVVKFRRIYRATTPELADLVVALDSVEHLGEFAELELLVTQHSELDIAQQRITELGRQLGLERIQPRSYLSQLLERLGID